MSGIDTDEDIYLSGGEGTSSGSRKSTIKRKKNSQKYKKTWENNKNFKGWIRQGKTEYEAYCMVCNKNINISSTGQAILLRHKESDAHMKLAHSRKKQPLISSFSALDSSEEGAKKADIYLASFVAEHNLSYNLMEHLPKLLKIVCPDSQIAKKIQCSRTKCASVVKNVIGKQNELEVIQHLKTNKFSLIIDESTDVSCTKHLSLVCRYVHGEKINDCFLALIPLKDATAEVMYNKITEYFTSMKINYKENLIGFASDGANVMTGKHNSVMSRLQDEIPNIFLMRCICHSFHLCASGACETLPKVVEDVVRDVYNYFSNSPKRIESLKEFQNFTNTKIKKILHSAQTRWLSLENVVKRILEQYNALILYFTDAVATERIVAAETILTRLRDTLTKGFLLFLEFALQFFNKLNLEMQSSKPKIHKLYSVVTATYKTILECFIQRNLILKKNILEINFRDPKNFIPLEQIYLGANTLLLEKDFDKEQSHILRTRCLQFYIESCSQISRRFDFSNKVLKDLEIIDPKNVSAGTFPSIAPLAQHFPNLIPQQLLQALDTEWRLLSNTEMEVSSCIETFWFDVKNLCFGDNSPMFPNLPNFVLNLLCLPHSSANVERIFSQVNLLKSKQRNKLSTSSIVGLLHTKNYLASRQASCYDVKCNKQLMGHHNKNMYAKHYTLDLSDSDKDTQEDSD